jgi:hypothetical protein
MAEIVKFVQPIADVSGSGFVAVDFATYFQNLANAVRQPSTAFSGVGSVDLPVGLGVNSDFVVKLGPLPYAISASTVTLWLYVNNIQADTDTGSGMMTLSLELRANGLFVDDDTVSIDSSGDTGWKSVVSVNGGSGFTHGDLRNLSARVVAAGDIAGGNLLGLYAEISHLDGTGSTIVAMF